MFYLKDERKVGRKMIRLNCAKISFVLVGIVIIWFLSMTSVSLATEGTWTQKADMPTARLGLTTSTVNGKIYAIGGYAAANYPGMQTVEEYDPATDTWTTKANMPTGRRWLSSSAVNGKIYAIGGYINLGTPGLSTVEEYDPTTDTWTTKTPMLTARLGPASCVVDGIIYVIGGAQSVSQGPISTVEAYDPDTDTWTTKTNMPTARIMLNVNAVNGKIYAIGGQYGSGQSYTKVEEYDPETDTWTEKADMPTARCGLATSVVNGKIFAIAGANGSVVFSTVEEYDPATNIWTSKTSAPSPRLGLSSSTINDKILAIGGSQTGSPPHPGTRTVYEYDPYPLVVDFNGDEIVDINDLLILIENWGTNEPLCDIAPTPWGDGIVDRADLEVLMDYWGQEVNDPTLITHWPLDETEGDIAYDSIGENNGTLYGEPLWQPQGGMVDGALELDGINDYISTDPVAELTSGPFSVFAWIKGGAPGQAMISQVNSANLIMADVSEGKLMTEHASIRSVKNLVSEVVITDGDWHRVGLTWNGTEKILYVDEREAESTVSSAGISEDGLYIGAGKNLEEDSFFSGLIDDVRIYNRAIIP
jgi:N-acetylneuraminic acid mutarotase